MRLPASALAFVLSLLSMPALPLDEAKPPASPPSAERYPGKGHSRPQPTNKIRKIDINSATAEQLTTLPGINGDKARQIMAGRPYGSKTWLVTHQIIDRGTYGGIKSKIEAKQPYRDARKNAEVIKKSSAQ